MATTSTDRRYGVNAGLGFKAPCKAATTANITLSGEQTVDGVALVTDDRCLVKNQTTASENGIYVVDTSSWERALDWDGTRDVKKGTSVRVTDGTVNQGYWYVTTSDPITPGTTSVSFSRTVNSSEVPAVATISALRSINPQGLSDNDTVIVLGYTTAGDGGGGDFYWDASSSDADDNGITILPTGYAGVGRWKRVLINDEINAAWFGAIGTTTGTPTVDDTVALQAALDYAKYPANLRVKLNACQYKTTAPLTVGQHQDIQGVQAVAQGTEIWFYGADGENAIQSDGADSTEKTRVTIEKLRILDKRTSPTSGYGIYLANVDNQTILDRLFVGAFPTAQIYFGAPSGTAADCLTLTRTWLSSSVAGSIGVVVERVNNNIKIDSIYADISSGIAIKLTSITSDDAVVTISNVKHEANNASYSASYSTIYVDQSHGNLVIDGVIQRNVTGTGCDIVQVANSSGSRMQIRNITGDEHLTWTATPYTVNVLAPVALTFNGRIDQMYFGTGGRPFRILGGNDTPEAVVNAYVGEMFHRMNGGQTNCVYLKTTGAGTTTGWRPFVPNTISADKGDAAATLVVGTDSNTNYWNTALTTDRAVNLSTSGVKQGDKFHIVRTASSTGAFNLNVGTGPLKALATGEWCDVEYNGSAWMLTAFGAL